VIPASDLRQGWDGMGATIIGARNMSARIRGEWGELGWEGVVGG